MCSEKRISFITLDGEDADVSMTVYVRTEGINYRKEEREGMRYGKEKKYIGHKAGRKKDIYI